MGLHGTHSPFHIGHGKCGPLDLITDVPGVTVGHTTIHSGNIHTGVTAVLPHSGNLFRDKVLAASAVFNGFGKTVGLIQLNELGTIETPIILTNTFSVGTAATALICRSLEQNPEIGFSTGTVNPIVCECNDGFLNDIRAMAVTQENVFHALDSAEVCFAEGTVGAGTGMVCFGCKGGIGSASRVVELDGRCYTVGALVLSNFGRAENLLIDGRKVGREITAAPDGSSDKGSIIMLLATDLPLSERQLGRICRRAGTGLARTGSFCGNGSGDIAVAFTTANRVEHFSSAAFAPMTRMNDDRMDDVFEMTAEAVEEAIISSLWHAETLTGRNKNTAHSLREWMGI